MVLSPLTATDLRQTGGNCAAPVANSTPQQVLVTLAITLPLLVYGVTLLRKVPPLEDISAAQVETGSLPVPAS